MEWESEGKMALEGWVATKRPTVTAITMILSGRKEGWQLSNQYSCTKISHKVRFLKNIWKKMEGGHVIKDYKRVE